MISMKAIGHVVSPYKDPKDVPRGLGAKHETEGVLEIAPEFELGLADIEGFSHLYVIWAFDRSTGYELTATPPTDNRPHGVFATRSPFQTEPDWLDCGFSSASRGCSIARARHRHARRYANSRYQALPLEYSGRAVAAWLAGRGGSSRKEVIRRVSLLELRLLKRPRRVARPT